MSKTLIEASTDSYNSQLNPTHLDIKTGCLQRIAKSLENMEKPYLRLLSEADSLARRKAELIADKQRMARRISALQGVITRMKKKAK